MRRLAIALLALAALTAGASGVRGAAPSSASGAPAHVDVVEMSGLLDPVQVDFLSDAVQASERAGAQALVVQLNSGGAVASRPDVEALVRRVGMARVPVTVWVGPTGARARGPAFELVQAAAVSGVAPGTRVGHGERLVGADQAVRQGLIDVNAPTLGDFVVELDGRRIGERTLETAEVVERPGQEPRRRPTVEVRLSKPGFLARLLHTAASPSVAYLLLVAGLALMVLELYTAGIGIAAVTATACVLLACYGLAVLPTRPLSVALLAVAVFGYAVDVQAGAARTWTAIATAALVMGSVRLYGEGLAPSPIAVVTVVAGMVVLMVAGIPAAVRSRFSTPTIGRESMVGELGRAVAAVDPEGTVEVRGARWLARTNRATPIPEGDGVRVVGVDGLLLEVEPEAPGAEERQRG